MSGEHAPLLVVGSGGQLGQELVRLAGALCHATDRSELDLDNPETVFRTVDRIRPEVVINTAAYNFVDRAEDEPDRAISTNGLGPLYLARACGQVGATLVHISTDYVFGRDAARRTPYREDDLPGPVNAYGVSKLTGEFFVLEALPSAYVLRTCGLYGLHGRGGKGGNFVETVLRLAAERSELRIVNDQRCTPTNAEDLARAILEIVDKRPQPGIYHVTNAGDCTWYEFASFVLNATGSSARCVPITSSEYPMRARRPAYSVLDNGKWAAAGMTPLRHWRDAVIDYLTKRGRRTISNSS